MKNTIAPNQELEPALFECFHIKFQQHKEIMEGDNQNVESDSKNKAEAVLWTPRCVLWGPEVSKRMICYNVISLHLFFPCFF